MYKHILIPTDGSDLSNFAIEHGIGLARTLGARITVIAVLEPPDVSECGLSMVEEYKERAAASATKSLNLVQDAAKASNVPCDLVCVEHEHPYKAIIETAQEKGCDVIVMASHGRRGFSAIVLGSETVKVLTHSAIPVVVVRGQSAASYFAAS
jgi:nucleotide-binding universal stress UspA family protein